MTIFKLCVKFDYPMWLKKIKEKLVDSIDNFIQKHPFLKKLLIKTKIRDTREKFSKLRTVFINHERPCDFKGEEPLKYSCNKIVTSKYTFLNFIPKNFFEQFRRIANFYFLLNILILFLIPDPPTNPYSSMIPLAIVISVTAIKQAYEDILRHKSDWEINSRKVKILKNGKIETIKSQNIKCGDIVEVKLDEEFPCDLVLLNSMSDMNTCYIKTANLDGETNLKLRSVPFKFPHLNGLEDLFNLRGALIIDKPNRHLYEFKGKLVYQNREYLISNENILLRGTSLKIVPAIYGCAIYTGKDSKMMLNSKFKSNKMSCIEKRLNYFVIIYIVVLLALSLLCLIGSILNENVYASHWYLKDRTPNNFKTYKSLYYFIVFMYFTNLNYIIPLSLYVTMELIRFVGSNFFEWDIKMYDENTNQAAKVNSTDLNEDLGQIEYLFSDKTGTLTENEMLFKHFCINGNVYEEKFGDIFSLNSQNIKSITNPKISKFLEALSICHTVQVDKTSAEKYNASSPDELSFIKFCLNLGIVYEGDVFDKTRNVFDRRVVYNLKNESFEKKYEILYILEFDSVRKRMSVIIKNTESNEYFLYCKGADTSIVPRCTCKTFTLYEEPLKDFSERGWRTLVIAFKPISESEYNMYSQMLDEANSDILNKEERLNHCYDLIESNLKILGITSVEDRLQEDVEGTLFALRQAGIKIWVLTGDKLETAVNISDSCKHFSKEMFKFVLKNLKSIDEIEENFSIIDEQMKSSDSQSYALIIDGISLETITKNKKQEIFRSVSVKCDAVLCCRMSPSQKAFIVSLVKNSNESPMTAAIGDGANDVSMIQEAHVGFGIFGKEGRNAARSSDFCFSKFKYLKRALLVHGYLYYTRAAVLVLYFFYKNFAFSVCQTYFGFWSAFSSTSVFSSLYISVFNLILSSMPPFIIALFEQQKNIKELEQNPFFYRSIRKNNLLSALQFLKWNILAVWHSLVCFFIPLGICQINPIMLQNGKNFGNYEFGSLVLVNIFLVIHLKIFLIWRYQNLFALFSYLMSLLGFLLTCLLLNAFILPFPLTLFTEDQALYFGIFTLFSSGSIWFTIFLSSILAILPDLVLLIIENIVEKVQVDKLVRKQKENFVENNRAKSPNTIVENFSLYSIGMERSTVSIESSNDLSAINILKRNNTFNSNRTFNQNSRRISPLDTLSQSVI